MPANLEALIQKLEAKVRQLREVQTELEQRLELATLDRELAEERARNYEVEAAKVPQLEELVEIGKQIEQSYAIKEQEILAKLHQAQASGAVQRLQHDLAVAGLTTRRLELELRAERVGIPQVLWEEGVRAPWALYYAEIGKFELSDIWQKFADGSIGVTEAMALLPEHNIMTLEHEPVNPAFNLLARLYEPNQLPEELLHKVTHKIEFPFELIEKAIFFPTSENILKLAKNVTASEDSVIENTPAKVMPSASEERVKHLEAKLERAKKLTANLIKVQEESKRLSHLLSSAKAELAEKNQEVARLQDNLIAAGDIDALNSALVYLSRHHGPDMLSPLATGPKPVYTNLAGLTSIANLRRYVKKARLPEFSLKRRPLKERPGWLAAQQLASLSSLDLSQFDDE